MIDGQQKVKESRYFYHVTDSLTAEKFLNRSLTPSTTYNAGGVLDFGAGFYVFLDKETAFRYCADRQRYENKKAALGVKPRSFVILTFEVSKNADLDKFSVKEYKKGEASWDNTVYQCRVYPENITRLADISVGEMCDNARADICRYSRIGVVQERLAWPMFVILGAIKRRFVSDTQVCIHAQGVVDALNPLKIETLGELKKEHSDWARREKSLRRKYSPDHET